MSTNDDIRLQSLQIGPVSIERGGERGGQWVSFQAEEVARVAEGPGGAATSRNARRNGTLTLTLRQTDVAARQIHELIQSWLVASAAPLEATSQNANALLAGRLSRPARFPRVITWGSAVPTEQPVHQAGEAMETISYQFRCLDIVEVT
jgi:hypothetical protein